MEDATCQQSSWLHVLIRASRSTAQPDPRRISLAGAWLNVSRRPADYSQDRPFSTLATERGRR